MAMIGQRMTAEEFLALDVPERPRLWLVDGEIVVNTPSARHQDIVAHLLARLYTWTEGAADRGRVHIELDHRVNDRNVYAPDVWWNPDGWDGTVPAIVVEVSSPSTAHYDRGIKLENYLAAGSLEVWLVDTRRDVVVIGDVVLTNDDVLTSPLLPGFELQVAELFDR